LYRSISDFKKSYQPRNKLVKDEKGDLVTDTHIILARRRRRRKHFSQLFNKHAVNEVR
jgi:hypothetical protein